MCYSANSSWPWEEHYQCVIRQTVVGHGRNTTNVLFTAKLSCITRLNDIAIIKTSMNTIHSFPSQNLYNLPSLKCIC